MKVVVQRVKEARVKVGGEDVSSIGKGLLLLAGFGKTDTDKDVQRLASKICKLRIFNDDDGKMNRDISETGGEILSVSQFTLLGDTAKGNRPGFDGAAGPEAASKLWERFNEEIENNDIPVKKGRFGAVMDVELVNDGPVTFVLESRGTQGGCYEHDKN